MANRSLKGHLHRLQINLILASENSLSEPSYLDCEWVVQPPWFIITKVGKLLRTAGLWTEARLSVWRNTFSQRERNKKEMWREKETKWVWEQEIRPILVRVPHIVKHWGLVCELWIEIYEIWMGPYYSNGVNEERMLVCQHNYTLTHAHTTTRG